MRSHFFIIFIIGSLALGSVGCPFLNEKHNVWKSAAPREVHFEHIVKWPGETLRIIAEWYTNDAENWSSLVDANPQIDQNNLLKGNIIYIPSNLLKNKKALPESFIASYNQKSKPSPKPPPSELQKPSKKPVPEPKPKKEEKKKQDDFELFGPK